MRCGHDPGVLEGNPKIENVAVRVKQIIRRIDDLGSLKRDILADLHVDAALREPGQMGQDVSLDDVELIYVADRPIELAEEMRVARVRPVHRLELEAEIVTGGLRIERALRGYQRLIQEDPVGLIREQMSEIDMVGRIVGIERDASFDMPGNLERAPPRGGGGCRRRLEDRHGQIGGQRRARNAHSKHCPGNKQSKNLSRIRHAQAPRTARPKEFDSIKTPAADPCPCP